MFGTMLTENRQSVLNYFFVVGYVDGSDEESDVDYIVLADMLRREWLRDVLHGIVDVSSILRKLLCRDVKGMAVRWDSVILKHSIEVFWPDALQKLWLAT